MRPLESEYAPYYREYIDKVEGDVLTVLQEQATSFPEFIYSIPVEKTHFAYAPGKWMVKEVIGYVLDTERIMAYRVLRIARKDQTPLAGFEEKSYIQQAGFAERSMERLAEEFSYIRKSNLYLFEALGEEQYAQRGSVSGYEVSVRALLFIIAGHLQHHRKIIEERYLVNG